MGYKKKFLLCTDGQTDRWKDWHRTLHTYIFSCELRSGDYVQLMTSLKYPIICHSTGNDKPLTHLWRMWPHGGMCIGSRDVCISSRHTGQVSWEAFSTHWHTQQFITITIWIHRHWAKVMMSNNLQVLVNAEQHSEHCAKTVMNTLCTPDKSSDTFYHDCQCKGQYYEYRHSRQIMWHVFYSAADIQIIHTHTHTYTHTHTCTHIHTHKHTHTHTQPVIKYVISHLHLHLHLSLKLSGSLGHHRQFHNHFPLLFSVLHCPLGLGKLQACAFPDVVFPPLLLSALSFTSPYHCALQNDLARLDEWKTCPYHFSLHLFMMVTRSPCGPIACWILARTSRL